MGQSSGHSNDQHWMREALKLAKQGLGHVEPNPMVGCVIVQPGNADGVLVGAGFHAKFGEPHAEVNAIQDAGASTVGATAFVTLEPCSHHGKTGPCADALIKANVARVVVATLDPHAKVAGQGIARLQNAGIEIVTGVCEDEAKDLLAPYLKRVTTGLPWIIAKWAMTWDGKIATSTGDSKWISNERSRTIVHKLRARVDAIMIGAETALSDDPLLTARPAGERTAVRVVVDSRARLNVDSQLAQTASDVPVILCVGPSVDETNCKQLEDIGVEIWRGENSDQNDRLFDFLKCLARRNCTNVLVEGGGGLLGSLFDLNQIDEAHCFVGSRLVGGNDAPTPMAGRGIEQMSEAHQMNVLEIERIGNDVYMAGRVNRSGA